MAEVPTTPVPGPEAEAAASEHPYDEALSPDESGPRPQYEALIEAVRAAGPARLGAEVMDRAASAGISFGPERFPLDPVPRLLTAGEWTQIVSACEQRGAAINRLCDDVYGEQKIVAAGVMPERVIETAEHYEPAMREVPVAASAWAGVVGLDLVRGPDGDFLVLEDNARSPSGTAFSFAARQAVGGLGLPGVPEADPAEAFEALGAALRAAAPEGASDPSLAIFSEGAGSGPFFEHDLLARQLGIPIVTRDQLAKSGGRLHARVGGERIEIDVLYRRCDGERLTEADGAPTALGGLLLEPLREGGLATVNAFGTGVADDKLTHAYIDEAIRFYFEEEPAIPSVPTYDLGDEKRRAEALERLHELVVKPRSGLGGEGVMIGRVASQDELQQAKEQIEANPERYVAQETITLSTHPTVAADGLEPRHVDLRPFAISTGERVRVPRSALTRYASDAGQMVVNSTRGGGAKDTWVLE